MDDTELFSLHCKAPTAARPLLGLTVLVVEDSRFASEALRLLCLRSGARIRRADCLRSARRHLQVYRPSVAIIDIGLRDGSGAELIAELAGPTPRGNVVIGMSGDPDGEQKAMEAGADAFLAKPITSLAVFQDAILSLFPSDRRPGGLRQVSDEQVCPDPIAYQDDLAHMADILSTAESDQMTDYVAQFLSGVARSAKDETLLQAAQALSRRRASGESGTSELARVSGLVQARLDQKIAM